MERADQSGLGQALEGSWKLSLAVWASYGWQGQTAHQEEAGNRSGGQIRTLALKKKRISLRKGRESAPIC